MYIMHTENKLIITFIILLLFSGIPTITVGLKRADILIFNEWLIWKYKVFLNFFVLLLNTSIQLNEK